MIGRAAAGVRAVDGKVVLVTDAGSGIGEAVARRLDARAHGSSRSTWPGRGGTHRRLLRHGVAVRPMREQGGGVIVNISSTCGLTGCAHLPHYSAAKAGVQGLTRAAARDLAARHQVNAVAPGNVDTPLGDVVLRRDGIAAVAVPVVRCWVRWERACRLHLRRAAVADGRGRS